MKRPSARKTSAKPPVEYPPFEGFDPDLIKFLKQLKKNNNRDWFAKNKQRYEDVVLWPALSFIQSIQAPMAKVSRHFDAVPKRMGGSLLRIYRDVRFSKNKDPYKTNVGIHFRHEVGKDVHAPGFYFHIEPESVFLGAGVWHPDGPALTLIREFIDDQTPRWKRAKSSKFKKEFEMHGDSLKRPPRGYDAEHPMIADLKMKDHIGLAELKHSDLFDANLISKVVAKMKTAKPFVNAICDALHLPC